ncbi:MmcQ/YjbR family DNA-binding protein [Roseicyclus sp.]|uniref:MmcQ/YjbR family DNA-binding protein n=1 Tax=Roseicyclus sp. TaxID=1914329 RepID=UPI003F9FB72A
MHQTFADRVCRALADTERQQPFGPDTVVWTVEGHMFAAYTENGHGVSLRMDYVVAARMVNEGRAHSPPSLTDAGWVLVPWETPPDELQRRIIASYRLVRTDNDAPLET